MCSRRNATRHGWTTWTWDAQEPMASYLAMMAIGEFDVRRLPRRTASGSGTRSTPTCSTRPAPRTGDQFAISQAAEPVVQAADPDHHRARRGRAAVVLDHPRHRGQLGLRRSSRPTPSGRTTGRPCPTSTGTPARTPASRARPGSSLHPFLAHYQTRTTATDLLRPTGTPVRWWAASGSQRRLRAVGGRPVRLRRERRRGLDQLRERRRPCRAPASSSTTSSSRPATGTTSFEDDGDTLDGWTVPGAPEGSDPNPNDWIVGTGRRRPPTLGEVADGSFARQRRDPRLPRRQLRAVPVLGRGRDRRRSRRARLRPGEPDPADLLARASSATRCRATASSCTSWPTSGSATASPSRRWQHIWLNEGFATYAEWLWSEHEGLGTAQEIFDFYYAVIPADDPFWAVTIGDPGPRRAVRLRRLRPRRDDAAAAAPHRRRRRLLPDPAHAGRSSQAGGNVTTDEFIALAERISGQQLDDLFETWLFTPEKPGAPATVAARVAVGSSDIGHAPAVASNLHKRLGRVLQLS